MYEGKAAGAIFVAYRLQKKLKQASLVILDLLNSIRFQCQLWLVLVFLKLQIPEVRIDAGAY